jgi:hypothetical protein
MVNEKKKLDHVEKTVPRLCHKRGVPNLLREVFTPPASTQVRAWVVDLNWRIYLTRFSMVNKHCQCFAVAFYFISLVKFSFLYYLNLLSESVEADYYVF